MPARAVDALKRPAAPVWALVALSYALALLQRPGRTALDTRIELSVDPALFLDRVGSLWSSTTDLGHVQSGQFVGYLFPMAPWYAAGDALGVPHWLSQRLFLGTLLALAAWGTVRLMDALWARPRGLAHLGAGLLFVLNPYVVQFASRGTVSLLAYAALPWLMLAAHRGLQEPHGWRWPATAGLVLAASGGGVNAAVIFFAVVGPLALVLYEVAVLGRGLRAARSFLWRAAVCVGVGSIWWIVPVLLQARYGADFLSFTEQPGTIWGTTSMSESLRLLGFWVLYAGVGFGASEPFLAVAGTYLFNAAVIVGSFAVPLLAVSALGLNRRWRYAPFLGLLCVGGLLVMFAGFPEGAPLRRALTFAYYEVAPLQSLRTTYKAAPLLALGLACLGGGATAELVRRARRRELHFMGVRIPARALAVLAAVPVLFALPLFSGRAIDRELAYGDVPATWPDALADAERDTPPDRRIAVLPGELFAWYRWGGTMDPVGPALSKRPVLIREIVRYADPRSSQLQATIDDLLQQDRLVPGQLGPLLRLMSVGQVLVPADSRVRRSGALAPASVTEALAEQPEVREPLARYGTVRAFRPPVGLGGRERYLPDIRRYAMPGSPGIVRVHPAENPTVVDGDADGIAALAGLDPEALERALFYAGDLDREHFAGLARAGAALVLTDSNRRRVVNPSRLRQNRGVTLEAGDPASADSPLYDLFPEQGDEGRTVARYSGLRTLRSPLSPGYPIFPERRPYAALDGRPDTSWVAGEGLRQEQRFIELTLERPLRVESLSLLPHSDANGRPIEVAVTVNGGDEQRIGVRQGWNEVPIGEPALRSLRVQISRVTGPPGRRGGGGIAELAIPGLRVRESLRLPRSLSELGRGLDLTRNDLSVLLERTRADFPYRAGAEVGSPQARSPLDMVDAEAGLERDIALPAPRRFTLDGWASVDPRAPDPELDRLAGLERGWRIASSSRFEGLPRRRASSAFDGRDETAWAGDLLPGRIPWMSWTAPRPTVVRQLRLRPAAPGYAFPARVRITAPGAEAVVAEVSPAGDVVLPHALRTGSVRMEILAVSRPPPGVDRGLRAVGVAEVEVPGLRPPAVRRHGSFATGCEELGVRAAGSAAGIRVTGDIAQLDSGRALHLEGCGEPVALPAGTSHLSAPGGRVMRPDHLRLVSRAPAGSGMSAAPVAGAEVIDPGTGDAGRRDGVRLGPHGDGWLVLGQSFSAGWRAWCGDGAGEASLGAPEPVDGYANGWRIGPDCRTARFEFAPQRLATASYWLSAAGCTALLLVLLTRLRPRRRRRPGHAASPPGGASAWLAEPLADPLRRVAWRPALAAGAAITLIGGFVFALRAGAVLGPLAVLLLRLGVSVRRLVALAALAIAALPALYLIFPARDKGGFSFDYAIDNIAAHWVAVGAVCCLLGAAALAAATLRRRDDPERALSASAPGSRSSK